jgi:hypothetical protein
MAWKPIPLNTYERIKSSCNSDTKLVAWIDLLHGYFLLHGPAQCCWEFRFVWKDVRFVGSFMSVAR